VLGTDAVIFDDSATGATSVNLATALTPTGVTVNSSILSYTFSGGGKLSGSTVITKQGAATLILANTGGNDYTGTTTISGGTLQVGDGVTAGAGQLGSGNIALGSGGTLALNRPSGDDITLANAISGAGTLVQQGGDIATLTGNSSSFGGAFTVTGGTLKVSGANALGTAVGTVASGGALDVTGFGIGNALTFNGGSVKAASGTNSTLAGIVTLSGSGVIADAAAGSTLTISGAIGGAGGLTKSNSGILLLSGGNTYTGATTIGAGTLTVGVANAISGGSAVTISGGTLALNAFNNTVASVSLQSGSITSTTGALFSAAAFDVQNGSASAILAGAVGLQKTTAGTVTLTGTNTYTGVTTINAGILNAKAIAAVNTASSIGTGSAGGSAADLVFGGGTLQYNTAAVASTNRLFTIGAASGNSATIDSSAASAINTLSFTGTGSVAFANATTHCLTFTGTNTGANTFAPVVGDQSAGNATSVTKSGAGTWALTGLNTYSGVTGLDGGILNVSRLANINTASGIGAGSAGGSAADLVFGGGTLQYNTAAPASTDRLFTIGAASGNSATIDSSAASAANTLSFTGTGGIAFVNATTHSLTLTGTNTGANTFAPVIADQSGGNATSLMKAGAGRWVLTGANAYTGATMLSAGTLQIGNGGTAGRLGGGAVSNNGTLTFNRTDTYGGPLGNAISGTGSLTLLAGTLTLNGSNTYSGATTVSAGTLRLDFSQAGAPTTNIIGSSSTLVLGGGTLNVIGKAGTTNSQTFNGVTLNVGASSISDLNNATANPLLIALGGITRNTGGTVNFIQPTGTISATNGFTTSATNTNGLLGGWATVGGTTWATNNGTNIIGLTTYTTTTAAGTTAANYSENNIDVDLSRTVGGVITANSLRFNTAAALDLTLAAGTNTISSGGILVTGNVGNSLSRILGGATLTGAAGKDLVIIQNNTANQLNISAVIANNGGATGLTKTGNGNLRINNVATYTGETRILAGTIQLGINQALRNGATVTLGDAGTNTGGTLDLNGFAHTVASLSGAGTGPNLVTNSSATAVTLTITGAGGVFGGVIQDGVGGVALSQTSGGSATLSGANTYTGQTLIQNFGMTLSGGDNRLSRSTPVQLNNGGRLILGDASGASDQTVSSLLGPARVDGFPNMRGVTGYGGHMKNASPEDGFHHAGDPWGLVFDMKEAEPSNWNNGLSTILWRRDEDKAWHTLVIKGLPMVPYSMKVLAIEPDGRMCGVGNMYGAFTRFDPRTGKSEKLGDSPGGSVYQILGLKGATYFCGYTAFFAEYDHASPYKADIQQLPRKGSPVKAGAKVDANGDPIETGASANPRIYNTGIKWTNIMLVGPDGRIYMGGKDGRHHSGGGFAIFNPKTKAMKRFPFELLGVRDMAFLSDNKTLAITTTPVLLGKPGPKIGSLMLFDIIQDKITREVILDELPKAPDEIVVAGDNTVLGVSLLAEKDENGNTTYATMVAGLDLANGKVSFEKRHAGRPFTGISAYDKTPLVLGPDGCGWLFVDEWLCRLLPNGDLEKIRRLPEYRGKMFFQDKTLYLFNGGRVMSNRFANVIRIPNLFGK
jgi:fibronectin-binding autotransporter adhesin